MTDIFENYMLINNDLCVRTITPLTFLTSIFSNRITTKCLKYMLNAQFIQEYLLTIILMQIFIMSPSSSDYHVDGLITVCMTYIPSMDSHNDVILK